MYRISKWKLALIIAVFVFSGLYLLPTVPGLYGRLYGYFNVWMEDKIPPPDVQSGTDGEYIRFTIPGDLPKGVSVVEAGDSVQNIVSRRLTDLGAGEEVEALSDSGNQFSFDSIVFTDLYIKFNYTANRADLEAIVSKLELGEPPLVSTPPEFPDGEEEPGDIKFIITKADVSQGKTMQQVVAELQVKLREQLQAQEVPDADFTFAGNTRNEVHVKFRPQKSGTELSRLIKEMQLYGGLPLALRAIFPDNELKQGLDLKGGFHVVQELDTKKAMDMYLDTQAKDVILGSLKSEDILCRSVEKTLEKRGANTIVVRPYVSDSSGTGQAQAIADMKAKLASLGFSDITETSTGIPELTARMDVEQDIGDLVDSILGGKNPLIVTIPIRQRVDKDEYLDTAEKTLDKFELFDKASLLRADDKIAIFSVQLSEDSARNLAEQNLEMVMKTLENRINKFGVAESTIRRVRGRPRILIQVPEEQDPAKTLKAITDPAILTFKLVKANPTSGSGMWQGGPGTPEPSPDELPAGAEVMKHSEGGWRVLDSTPFLVGGQHLKGNSATVRRGEFGSPEVIMFLNREGQKAFSNFTGEHVGEFTAILLDDVIHTNPRINEKISTASARITGDFTEEEADYLAKILRPGHSPLL